MSRRPEGWELVRRIDVELGIPLKRDYLIILSNRSDLDSAALQERHE
jgi:hypothetical protein